MDNPPDKILAWLDQSEGGRELDILEGEWQELGKGDVVGAIEYHLAPTWKLIADDSPPKDGTEFLCWKTGWLYPHSAVWDSARGTFENPFTDDYMDQPTHWKPLDTPTTP